MEAIELLQIPHAHMELPIFNVSFSTPSETLLADSLGPSLTSFDNDDKIISIATIKHRGLPLPFIRTAMEALFTGARSGSRTEARLHLTQNYRLSSSSKRC